MADSSSFYSSPAGGDFSRRDTIRRQTGAGIGYNRHMFTTLIPPAPLADWCRMLRHQLAAGLSPTQTLTSLAKSGPPALRPLSARLLQAVKEGQSFGDAMEKEREVLPAIVLPMVQVGDETGHLP